jgi:AraC-like DNA-binding protein
MTASRGCKIPIGLSAALHEAGISRAGVLASAGLPSRLLDEPSRYVSPREYFALWRAIRTVSGDPNIGIVLATSVKPDLTEPLFLAILSAADVAGAIGVVSRFKRLLEPQDLAVRADAAAKQVLVSYEWPASEALPPQVLVDAELAFIVEVSRRGTRCAELSPRELHLRASVLEEDSGHVTFFRCPIRLNAAHDAIVLAAEDTARPFVTHNPQLLSALLPYLQANTPPSPTSAVARVRSVITERVRGQRPDAHDVARDLAMSTRAMQRLLKDNGTSFRRLLDEVRNEHARGYLASTSFSDGEVSFLLGFDDPNSFYRAFRSWNGMSPSEFRKHSGAGV